jgi:hypothetical protein
LRKCANIYTQTLAKIFTFKERGHKYGSEDNVLTPCAYLRARLSPVDSDRRAIVALERYLGRGPAN